MEKERRPDPRLEFSLDVQYILEGSDEPRRGRIHDLSAGGAALLLPEVIPPTTHFTSVQFLLPAERNLPPLTIETPAETVHSKRQPDVDGRLGSRVGIRFEGLSEEHRKQIQQFVDLQLMRKETPPSRPVDRRRVPLEQPVSLRFGRFDSFVTVVSANISETGMFITATDPKPPGSVFEFHFTLGNEFTPGDEFMLIEGEAEVVWVRRESARADKPSGMGVRFRHLADDSRAVIRRLVDRYIAEGHTPFDLEEAPVEEVGVSGAPQRPAGEAIADVGTSLEEDCSIGRAVGAGQALSHREAEPPVEAEAPRGEIWNPLPEREELERRLRQELQRAEASQAELRDELENLKGGEAALREELDRRASGEPGRRRARRALRAAGLLAGGVALGAVGLFSLLQLAPGLASGLGGESARMAAREPPSATVSEFAPRAVPRARREESAEPVAPSEAPDPAAAGAVVRAWAAAWSKQRIEEYLSFYARDFQPPGGLGHSEWEELRRQRLEGPSWIKVRLGPLEQEALEPGHTRISFGQFYETPTYRGRLRTTLELVWEDGTWKIRGERVQSV